MSKWLLFGGTTEGRILAQDMSAAGFDCDVCVATQYGEMVLTDMPGLKVRCGRLEIEEMKALILEEHYDGIIDATHPFATVVKKNIRECIKQLDDKIPFYPIRRMEVRTSKAEEVLHTFSTVDGCVEALLETQGNILLTTGTKDLSSFCAVEDLRRRLIVRVLPGMENLKLCYDNGLEGKQIIAMQGPFSKDMNVAIIKQYSIKQLVTKESGRTGGLEEKLLACTESRVPCYMIQKPATDNVSAAGASEDVQKEFTIEEMEDILQITKKASAKNMEVILAGIGMGDALSMTCEVKELLADADYIFGAPRMIEAYTARKAKYPFYLAKDIVPQIEKLAKEEKTNCRVMVLFSGDSGFYSGSNKLFEALKEVPGISVKLVPGISSMAALAARGEISWQDAYVMSTHGVKEELWKTELVQAVARHKKVFFLSSGPKDIQKIGALLTERCDCKETKILLGYNLSYPDEQVMTVTPAECAGREEEGLYCGFILQEEFSGHAITPGWKDEMFLRDKVPMTKEEVRAISICKLELTDEAVVYDIGSGTGSIAMEVAMLSPGISVYAIETNETALRLIHENKEKFGAYSVQVVEALAPNGLNDLPAPTHAFIGGTKGNLKEILDVLYQKNPSMKVVMNAVSMESICQMQLLSKNYPMAYYEVTQVVVNKAKEMGEYHMMTANNPVTIFAFQFRKQ